MRTPDINALVWVSDPQLSPAGTHVAYVVNRVDEAANRYSNRIWLADVTGADRPRPLTAGEESDTQPRWSPDGTQLAFVRNHKKTDNAPARSTLRLMPIGVPGETTLLAEREESISEPAWSPDGSLIAVTSRVRGPHYAEDEVSRRPPRKIESLTTSLNGEGFVVDRPRHVHLIAVDGSCPMRDITPGPWECSSPSWMPDGTALAIGIMRFDNNFAEEVGTVAIAVDPDAEPTPPSTLTDATGSYFSPQPLPSGDSVLVTGYDNQHVYPQNYKLGVLPATGTGTPEWKSTALDRSWAPMMAGSAPAVLDDDTVIAGYEDRGNTHLARLSLSSGQVERIIDGELSVTGWSAAPNTIAYTATTATMPAELYALVDGESRRLTHHTDAFVARVEPRAPEHFLAGDAEIDAWIITPHDFDPSERYPMVFNIHGGPHTQYGNFFFDEAQMQARAGFVVVYSNPRGGSGRDTEWSQAILGPKHPIKPGSGWGGDDYDDLMTVVDIALERYDFIDPDRLGVIGGSYGGYMASWIVSHNDRFAAACSERAANNLLALEHSSDIGGFFYAEMGPKFYDDPDEYVRMSPTTYVKDINTPLLIIHSEDDLRCPADQAYQLFNSMTLLGKDVEFYLFPGENHELSRSGSPIHRVQRADIIHEYFGRHLGLDDAT